MNATSFLPLVLALGAAGSLAGSASAQTTHLIQLQTFSFSQPETTIQVGDTVRWVWQTGIHNVESGFHGAYDGNFSSGSPSGGPSFQVTFDQTYLDANPMEGDVYPYYCITHLFLLMYGRIVVDRPHELTGDGTYISGGAGGAQVLSLDSGPAFANHLYWVLGSASGVAPGLAGGAFTLPLNFDNYMLFHLSNPNTLIANSLGFLDAAGQATATFAIPAGFAQLAALSFHHAYMVLDPVTLELVEVSNAWPLTFIF